MAAPTPRVRLPKSAKAGVPFRVRTRITHPMHTGLLHDRDGKLVPRRIINRFSVRYGGEVAIAVDLKRAVSADPYFEFEMAVPSRASSNSNGWTMTARHTGSASGLPSSRAIRSNRSPVAVPLTRAGSGAAGGAPSTGEPGEGGPGRPPVRRAPPPGWPLRRCWRFSRPPARGAPTRNAAGRSTANASVATRREPAPSIGSARISTASSAAPPARSATIGTRRP